jgi:hypothetical protein
MKSIADVFSVWPTDAELGRDIGISYPTLSAWKQRGSIPAAYWRDIIRAARKRGRPEITAELLVDLHAREPKADAAGFAEEERPFDAQPVRNTDEPKPEATGHFIRFKHLRRSNFASIDEVNAHISALRDEWERR